MTEYRVDQVAPHVAEDELMRLWQQNLAPKCDLKRRFDWVFRKPPEPPADVYLLATEEHGSSKIVGSAGATPRRFSTRGKNLRAALLVDLAVDREHRTLLPALTLVRRVSANALEHFDFAYGFPNRRSRGVFRRAGHVELGRLTRYVCVLRHASYLERLVCRQSVAKVGAAPLDGLKHAAALSRAAVARLRYRLEWLDAPDQRFDALWCAARAEYEMVGRRTASFLSWRFTALPGQRVRFAALRTRSGELRAYVAVRDDDAATHCHDLFGFRRDFGPLLDLLSDDLYRAGKSSISLAFFGDAEVVKILRRRGFSARESERVVCASFRERLPGRRRLDPNLWHVTDADEDC